MIPPIEALPREGDAEGVLSLDAEAGVAEVGGRPVPDAPTCAPFNLSRFPRSTPENDDCAIEASVFSLPKEEEREEVVEVLEELYGS